MNFDNYQNWTDGMKILLSVKMMWSLINGISKQFDFLKSINRMKWLIDDVQTKTWIYTNLKDNQHNHIKKMIIANAMWIRRGMGRVGSKWELLACSQLEWKLNENTIISFDWNDRWFRYQFIRMKRSSDIISFKWKKIPISFYFFESVWGVFRNLNSMT